MWKQRNENQMVTRLKEAAGERLIAVVVYGPAAHDGEVRGTREHLLLVLRDLELETLRTLAEPVRWWLEHRQPWPRLFSPELLRASADVFPIELLDLASHRRVLHGPDVFADIVIDHAHLRIQCERELREKLMRLREGYVECRARAPARGLRELLAASYPDFARIFRGVLYLLGTALPERDHDVVTSLCERLDLSPAAFDDVERIARGERGDSEAVFVAYYRALTIAEERIDRLIIHQERSS
jgi:hypothetical protein